MSQKRKKAKKHQPGHVTQAPYGARILQAWLAREKADEPLLEMDYENTDPTPEMEKLRSSFAILAVKFDNLIEQAWISGQFKRTVASMAHQAGQAVNAGRMAPDSAFEMMEAAANAHHGSWRAGADEAQKPVELRTVIFGIPVSGSLDGIRRLAGSDFVSLVRKTGWAPDRSNVACLGILTVSDAMSLAQDPVAMWNLQDSLHKTQSRDRTEAGVKGLKLPGSNPDEGEHGVTMTGGYVLLLSAFCVGDETCPAVDFPDDPEAMEAQWSDACMVVMDAMDGVAAIDTPQALDEAWRSATGLQLMLTLALAKAQENLEKEYDNTARCIEVAFTLRGAEEAIDIVGLYEDGSQIRVPNALPPEAIWFLDDIANILSQDVDVSMVAADGPLPWHEHKNVEQRPESEPGRILPFRPRTLH